MEPETLVFAHVRCTGPCVHPVVRPTLLSTVPTGKLVASFSWLVIVKNGEVVETVRLPLLAPVVFAISPRFDATSLE